MRKLERRAIICLIMAAVLLLGSIFFVVRFVKDGSKWATFYGNQSIYTDGRLNRGAVYDVNGQLLAKNGGGTVQYNDDPDIREATVHAVGDMDGNIATSAMSIFTDKIIGYNLWTGTYNLSEKSNDIKLTLDADVCKVAYEAMAGRNGTVGVYNYKTGDIICMVSTPTFDPLNPPQVDPDDNSGIFINKFLSATMAPGSIFKLVTAAAAIENLPDWQDFSYTCPGVRIVNGEKIACVSPHGYQNFEDALANSCNGAFSKLAEEVGPPIMSEYVKKLGLTSSYDVNGIHTKKGSFEFPDDAPLNLGWAGIGQYKDEVNPCGFMVYMGAIANGGKAAEPNMISSHNPFHRMTDRMIEESTADTLNNMMKHNVEKTYGEGNFPGLDIYAKSGTAEVAHKKPTAWFAGYIKNEDKPYAFIVCIENSGYGSEEAGPVANKVLQSIVNKD